MLIKQEYIRSLNKLRNIQDGSRIVIGIKITAEYKETLKRYGYSDELRVGETCLPKALGTKTKRNADGYEIIHRDQPKEMAYRMIEWTYKQWSGYRETTEVTMSTEVPYERYPRTHVEPLSIEFTIIEHNGEKKLISPVFVKSEENKDKILQAINVILEMFGECRILDENLDSLIPPEIRRLNWEVLPKGRYPWKRQKERIQKFIDRATGTNKATIERRLETVNKYEPDFTAIGSAGFNGYIIHGFSDLGIYILESIYINNATYVLGRDWEEIAKLSKAEILNNDLHTARIIHNRSWFENINEIMKD